MASLDSLTSWHSDWKQLNVAVVGLGVTGFSVADTLAELGCEVLVVAILNEKVEILLAVTAAITITITLIIIIRPFVEFVVLTIFYEIHSER